MVKFKVNMKMCNLGRVVQQLDVISLKTVTNAHKFEHNTTRRIINRVQSCTNLNTHKSTRTQKQFAFYAYSLLLTIYLFVASVSAEHVRELEVSEGVPIGHQIGFIGEFSHGVDSGPPYLIVPVPGSGVDTDLAIDHTTGEIRTKVYLDRETRASYSLVAIPLSGENVRVVVRVLDENDNAPTFPQPVMNIEFPENTPRDVKRTLNPARDLDLGQYNTQRYNIVSGNVNNAFRLSSHRERDDVLYLDLQINGFLDRETTPAYSLVIEALDGGSPPLRGQMTVNITIQDVNDNQPIFNQSRYFATVPENATVGTSVLQVFATDTDADENGLVGYAINRRQSDKDKMFRIDPETGLISVNKPLDFEAKELHELVVVAKDHGEQPLETTAFVSIRVTDVNDNLPTINVIFLSDDATPKISESAKPGEIVARISVNDPDSKAEYSNVNVTLNGGDGHFGLNTRDNIIYLVIVSQPLDREAQSNYTLSVVATDNGTPPLHASKTIYLRVTDINDNAPEFEHEVYHANVMEVADPGTSVLQVAAFDRDEGNNSAVIYALADTPETHAEWFQIDSHTGLITTRAHIDCETEPVPQLTVIAKDNGHPPLSSTATILVTIHDVNDNEPIFDQSFYNVSVAENEPVGRCILKVSASDPDCGVNAMVNYTLGDGIKRLAEFEVRSATGEICIASDLDYEKRNSYEFPVIATDRGGLSTIARIKIQLTDVNDNRPVFYPREYNVSLRETAGASAATAPIVAVVATDADAGRFGAVTYRIVAGNDAGIFRIDRTNGEIFINRPNMLSVRTQPVHVLNISASDGGGMRSSSDALVFLSIIDATQRPPIFEKPRYSYHVKEDVPGGTVVGSVMATSNDAVNRNGVRYSIYSGDPEGYFSIDAITGNIRIVNPLDHETKPQILLNIQAMSGDPAAYGHTQVNIDIEDVNDNAPEFETNLVRISVPENADLDTALYAAHAHDKDSGKSGEITYTMHMISADQYQSAEQQQQYLGNTSNAIQLARPTLNTFAGAPTGALAIRNRLGATGTTTYAAGIATLNNAHMAAAMAGISAGVNRMTTVVAEQNVFAIDARSGHLTLSRHLDYETAQRHALIVTATDGGEPPLSSNLTILVEVQDVNDNPPMFERNDYSVKVLESLPINSQILQVTAIDLDTGNNARITYRLVSSANSTLTLNASGKLTTPTLLHPSGATKQTLSSADAELAQLFGIFPNSGWLYLRGTLDRESRDRYELTILASDNGTPSAHARARVIVEVLDANDNDPHFLSAAYEFVIEENMPRGALVGVVGATDLDVGENAEIRYSLIPSNTSFQVNAITGEITTREPLDRELRAVYGLVAEARDQGTPYRSARIPIKVHITDVNDNAPDIVDPQEDVVSVREEQPPGTEVVRIRAVDRDNGQNASITYSILKGRDSDGYGLFNIDAVTGVIRTRVVLDHEDRSIYRLAVAATDGGNPPKQSIRLLRVEVLDLNDNRPTFTSSSLAFRVPENVPVGFVVGSVSPNERIDQQNMIDGNSDLFVTYTLTSLVKDVIEGAFDIDRHTGSLVVARQLDREVQSEFRLEIRALDTSASNNPQSSAITVKVEIADVNDNPPRWLNDPIELKISEATDVGAVIHNFSATDADMGSNSNLHYKLLNYTPMSSIAGNEISNEQTSTERKEAEPIFSVDALTGALTLLAPLDYESTQQYTLIVEAMDQSSNVSSRLRTKVTTTLLVTDVNDNAPKFVSPVASSATVADQRFHTPPVATVHVSDALRIGETVAHIVAIDKDAGANGEITYAIVSGNEAGHFRMNSQTGYMELAKQLPPTATSGIGERIESGNAQGNRYNLVVSASDHGSPTARQSQLKLQILVQGTNSNPPRFHQSVYYANISESAAPGTFVLQVAAKSFNGGDSGNLSYEIPTGVADNHFHVDRQRGIVTTRGQFDRETKARYTIPIYVYDTNNIATTTAATSAASTTTMIGTLTSAGTTATSPLAATAAASSGQFDIATIIVTISDVNDHAPEFRPGACYALSVPENNEFSVIHTVVATDLDEGANGEIFYSIVGGNIGNKFSIDMQTGELTARCLDREQHSRYLLQIQAQDRGTPNTYQGHCNITVVVEDHNDNDPRFEQTKYMANIAESAAVGASVLRVKATDADLGINARLVYSLANETQWLFAIDSKTGIITTVGPLDRERQSVYNFLVVATDGGRYSARSAQVPVQIVVDDVNDNRPIFERYPFRAQVPALIQPGQMLLQVSATDVDAGNNGEILYSLGNNADAATRNKFRINPSTGVVSATQSLASESGRLLHIEVVARDKGNPARTALGLIELRVGDMAAGAPVLRFQNDTYRLKLRENSAAGMRVLQVSAVRSDGRRQQIYYSIGAGNEDGAFNIEATTGEIKVGNAAYLDYDRFVDTTYDAVSTGAGGTYRGRAMFYDGEEQLSANLENVTNIMYEEQITDSQQLNRNQRELKMLGNNENMQYTASAVQRHELRLVLVARTDATPHLYAYAELIIELEDENDNSPHFSQTQYSKSVWEGNNKGTFVVQVQAFDADAGANARILYHIVDGNHDNAFVIEPAFSGIVKTNIVLDREIRDMYKLKVIATDEGVPQMTGTATIRVHIVDVNDNQPTFPPHSVISVSEGIELGTVITTVSANDVDTYPALTYRFGGDLPDTQEFMSKPLFAIDRNSGKVTLRRHLDYEDQQEHQLEIIASDAAHEVRTTLTVRVSDENDNAPIFDAQLPPAYAATLPDQQVISTAAAAADIELVMVNATDADAEGRNSEIHYNINPPLSGFSVNEQTGAVFVNMTRLGAVANDLYVMITAQDGGVIPLKSSTVLRVHASKGNSGRVQFLQTQYRAQINEAAPLGTVVLRLGQDVLNAHADRVAGSLLFKIVSGNEDATFEVYQSSAIILVKPLDRERSDIYKLRLVVSDTHASPQQLLAQAADNSSTAINIFVTVEDANDNAPKFATDGKYEAEVSELAPLRYSIAKLVATDVDLENTPNSEVVYDITSGNDEGMFTIDLVSGVLFVNNKLDFDTGEMSYALVIRACDSAPEPLCSLQPFRLTLRDENDNVPRFPVTEYVEFVGENEPVGTSVFTARATDLDRGAYGRLNYSVDHEAAGLDDVSWKLFRVDPHTGIVTSNAVFDYEQRHRYDFVLRATDSGSKSARVKVRIEIESKDEFAPQFTERTYRFVMPSPSTGYLPLGYIVGQVTATDRDKGPDGRIVYQLSSQHAYFKVNRTNGAVVIKKKVDDNFDDGRDISLVIAASSGRQGSLTNMTVVEISLDPLASIGTNLASNGGGSGSSGVADWLVGLIVAVLLVLCAIAGIFLFVRMRSRKPRNVTKPHLSTETVGASNSYVDPSVFDTIPIRGGVNSGLAGSSGNTGVSSSASGQFAPPKYDEIPPYGAHAASSNSGAATTSELSGSEQSGSSGRGSAEDDGEDEEIRMINEGPLHHRNGAGGVNGEDGRMSDISVQNTQEYLARLGIVDREANATGAASTSSHRCSDGMSGSQKETHLHHPLQMHMYDEDPAAQTDITNLIYAKLNDVAGAASDHASSTDEAATTAGSVGVAVDRVINFTNVPVGHVPNVGHPANVGPPMNGSLSSIVHSEEELTGSYNWDYLLDWGPQYQPLAHVFSEIARLKDDNMSVHSGNSGASSSAKSKQSQAHSIGTVKTHIPPPLLTNVAPRAINMAVLSGAGVGVRLPQAGQHHIATTSLGGPTTGGGQVNASGQYMAPRSPISHDTPGGFSTSTAMSPSFSPSLSPLATRSPSISPLGGVTTGHHLVSLPRHAPQPTQRGKNAMLVEQEMRVRM
ncbi:PREDICTED: protein dachsous isoform X1 [Bactrocera latifrons]|uniref:Protein dachsous n=2 Tax=Bactrocera latifrons TaxID=174628 RepID=A0A0K8V577_BACLA|nr:PREDICTED: protein dachsous isoform X1 [Bactrocera latifrons]